MIIVIDGYNLLKQIFPHAKGKLDKQRDAFIRQLGYYKSKKSKDLKEIIVVFDAGPFSHATREIHHNVVIVFSGQKSSADDWIIEYVQRHKGEELLVVTMDRKIITQCEKDGATTLGSLDFYGIMQNFLLSETAQVFEQGAKDFNVEKFDQEDELVNNKIDRKALDLMMEQSTVMDNKDEDVDLESQKGRKSNPATLSKKDRRLLSKIKKLH
jgi:predicted RNA-binding protein with PIN domain